MNVNYRKYLKEDQQMVLDVWLRATKQAHPFLSEQYIEQEMWSIPNQYIPMSTTWVAYHDKRVIGFVCAIKNEIGGLFVDPDFQKSGAGRGLLDIIAKDQKRLTVEVFAKNKNAQGFYQHYGFKPMDQIFDEETNEQLILLEFS